MNVRFSKWGGEKKEGNLDEIEDILGKQAFPNSFKEILENINKQ